MRIGLVSQEYPPETAHGGIGTQSWNKAHALTALGHEVEVISCMGEVGRAPLRTSKESGITVHRMCPPGEHPGSRVPVYDQSAYILGYTWAVLETLHRVSERRRFDLVNFPEYGAEGYAFQLNRTPHNWVPVVVQLHGPLAMFAERVGWPEKGSPFHRTATHLEGESIRMADALMASSANIADFVSDHYGVERARIRVVHCGIDCEMFHPRAEARRDRDGPIVLFVGNIAISKGIRTVFDAVMRLRSRFPGIVLQVLGKGDPLWGELEARARRVGAGANVERLDFINDRARLAEVYQAADVFASPAHHEVGVANVYVEAMACGCPVVASTTGGAPEAVTDGESGLLVPPRDVDATESALGRLLDDASLRRRMGEAGRRRASGYFARERYIARVLEAYRDACERSPGGEPVTSAG